jgi:hypothetical protein
MGIRSERSSLSLSLRLVEEAKGELTAAAVISGKMVPGKEIDRALGFAKRNAATLFDGDSYEGVGKFRMESLLNRLEKAAKDLRDIQTDWGKIVAARRLKRDTSSLFESRLDDAKNILTDRFSGAVRDINYIVDNDKDRPEASDVVLNLLADASLALNRASRHIDGLRNPRWYQISPSGYILIASAVLILSTTIFLLLEHSGSVQKTIASSSTLVANINQDVTNPQKTVPARAVSVSKSIWDFVPSAAKIITAIPIVLAFVRKIYTWDKKRDRSLRRWQSAFKELGTTVK